MQFQTNPKSLEQASSSSLLELRRTKGLFFALCCYLLSQSFTIPLVPIGPSWAVWPNFPDLAVGLLVLMLLFNFRWASPASHPNRRVFLLLLMVLYGSILSYTFYLSWADKNAAGVKFGIFQIYRLIEFITIFRITTYIPLTPGRINVLRRIVDFVLVFVCLGIILTFFGIIPLSLMIAHLPQSFDVAGPWSRYIPDRTGSGWGTISYHHAYVSLQVFMLVVLRIHLSLGEKKQYKSKNKFLHNSNNILLLLSVFACFLSGSRAGIVTILLFLAIYLVINKTNALNFAIWSILAALPAMTLAKIMFAVVERDNTDPDRLSIFDRQKTLLNADDSENLAGRDQIWVEKLSFLDEEPRRWLLGEGFGSASDSGSYNAHMLYLHIITETGIVGLFCFGLLFAQILSSLYRYELGWKPIFWATISLLFSSLTQENFYPVDALGHFIGFYLCSVAIALRWKIQANYP